MLGWAPQGLQQADDDVARRVLQLYDEREPRLAAALRQGLDTSRMASASGLGALRPRSSPADPEGMALIATGAAKLMAAPDGPRVAALASKAGTPMSMPAAPPASSPPASAGSTASSPFSRRS